MSRDDISAIGDAGVQQDRRVVAEFSSNFWQQVEGDRGAIELAATVIRQQDAIDAGINHATSIFQCLNTFHYDLARPDLSNNLEVVLITGRVESACPHISDSA